MSTWGSAGGGWLREGEAGQSCRVAQSLPERLLAIGWDPGGAVEFAPECLGGVVEVEPNRHLRAGDGSLPPATGTAC
jgi:hypothetical protein